MGSWVKGQPFVFHSVARACRGGAGKGESRHDLRLLVEFRKLHPVSLVKEGCGKDGPLQVLQGSGEVLSLPLYPHHPTPFAGWTVGNM